MSESSVIPNRIEGSRPDTPMSRVTSRTRCERSRPKKCAIGVRGAGGTLKPGIGIAQWTSSARRQGLFQHVFQGRRLGVGILFDLPAQVDYLVTELRRRTSINAILCSPAVTVNDAADEVVYRFEVPGSVLEPVPTPKPPNFRRRLLPRADQRVQNVFARRRQNAQHALRRSPASLGPRSNGNHDLARVRPPGIRHAPNECRSWRYGTSSVMSQSRSPRPRFDPGSRLSLHALEGVAERQLVVEGSGLADVGDLPGLRLVVGDVLFIPPGVAQRLVNDSDGALVVYCICSPRFTVGVVSRSGDCLTNGHVPALRRAGGARRDVRQIHSYPRAFLTSAPGWPT